ncbi:hypothetical protein BKA69DRAFT_1073528 [Paraphysoderma sedebokerense]|nr:hypothetical protein BKA69DRAFT_1073528 [Paraphysoderma sedebokerense]
MTPSCTPLQQDAVIDAIVTKSSSYQPLSWPKVLSIIKSDQLHLLSRTPTQIAEYEEWMKNTKLTYKSIEDFILHKVFGVEVTELEVDNVECGNRTKRLGVLKWRNHDQDVNIDDLEDAKGGKNIPEIVFRMNDFPYHFSPGIIHYVLWNRIGGMKDAAILDFLKRRDELRGIDGDNIVWWVNPVSRKTVKGIWHAHVLVNTSSTTRN